MEKVNNLSIAAQVKRRAEFKSIIGRAVIVYNWGLSITHNGIKSHNVNLLLQYISFRKPSMVVSVLNNNNKMNKEKLMGTRTK